jgi:hypothetical protein
MSASRAYEYIDALLVCICARRRAKKGNSVNTWTFVPEDVHRQALFTFKFTVISLF